jgi:hypothetical protein
VYLEASTKPHVHKKIHEFKKNMAFTMAYPNFKKGFKMAFAPLGIKTPSYLGNLILKGPSIQIVDDGWSNPILTLKVISFAFKFNSENEA